MLKPLDGDIDNCFVRIAITVIVPRKGFTPLVNDDDFESLWGLHGRTKNNCGV